MALTAVQNWRAYLTVCKPKVVLLMLITAGVGMVMAGGGLSDASHILLGLLGIALTASAGAAMNHLLDQRIDGLMRRTEGRPLPTGLLSAGQVGLFALILTTAGALLLWYGVNPLCAVLTVSAWLGYALIYTGYLKRATPQNIVIGGLAGAMPPLLGWTAITGHFAPNAWLLVLIIYVWTPPHFWSLAIYRLSEYTAADIPMLPVTHGVAFTKYCLLLYTGLLILVTLLPVLVGLCGGVYLLGAVGLNGYFLRSVWRLYRTEQPEAAMRSFRASIVYLFGLFVVMLVDHMAFVAL